jgi:hypothetical protein
MDVLEEPEPRRRWKAWAILERDESLHRISMEGPDESEPIRRLIDMGWFAVPVDVIEA